MSSTAPTVDLTEITDSVRSLAEDLREAATQNGRELGRTVSDLPANLPDLDHVRAAVADKLPSPLAEHVAPPSRGRGRAVVATAVVLAIVAGGVLVARSRRRPAPVDPVDPPPAGGADRADEV